MKKTWSVTAHETLVHSWTVEAETEEEARELAGSGCPMPDGDCESAEFEIVKIKPECVCCESMISQVGCACGASDNAKKPAKKYTLEVFADGCWHVTLSGLTHEEALEESTSFTRFRIVEDGRVSL